MEISAKQLFELIWSLETTSYKGLMIKLLQEYDVNILNVKQYMPENEIEVNYEIAKYQNARLPFELRNKDIIFIEGTIYKFTCLSNTASGIPHSDVVRAYRNIVKTTKKGDFVINHNRELSEGMCRKDIDIPYSSHVRIVNGGVKDVAITGENKTQRYTLSGYTCVDSCNDGEIRSRLIASGLVSKLQLNDYLTDDNKI